MRMHDLSLGNKASTLRAFTTNRDEMKRRTRWRYQLRCRDPQRIIPLIARSVLGVFASGRDNAYIEKLKEEVREDTLEEIARINKE